VASLAAFDGKVAGAAASAQEEAEALQSAIAIPSRHVAEATVQHVMGDDPGSTPQLPAASGDVPQGAGLFQVLPPRYQDIQDRQQHVLRLLQQRDIQLELERKGKNCKAPL
jgi:hypothetical protein